MENLAKLLPEKAPEGLWDAAFRAEKWELGGEKLLITRQSVTIAPEIKKTMNYLDWEERDRKTVKKWGARCTCTACENEFYTLWGKQKNSIIMIQGADGAWYDTMDGEQFGAQEVTIGSEIECPMCGAFAEVSLRSAWRGGHTFAMMAGQVVTLPGGYTAVVSFLLRREIDEQGDGCHSAEPFAAMVLTGRGRKFYTHRKNGFYGDTCPADGWRECRYIDAGTRKYRSFLSINGKKLGRWMRREVPDMTGTTGEKTGLADYIGKGGLYPELYTGLWREMPAIENLLKSPWGWVVVQGVDDEAGRAWRYGRNEIRALHDLPGILNGNTAKPHEMLGMTRECFRRCAERQWSYRDVQCWLSARWSDIAGPEDAEMLHECMRRYGVSDVEQWIDAVADGEPVDPLDKVDRYLQRQCRKYGRGAPGALGTYVDYMGMLRQDREDDRYPADVLWPKNLWSAHDRMAASQTARSDRQYIEGFQAVCRTWGGLEWTDGKICAVLPKVPGDLTREGDTLHHCVGSYKKSHAEGKIIVFIRHRRRPERSWYTLSIDTTGKTPKEIQLHGYRNEWVNGKHLTIPAEVRAFCDRWEREVLAPQFHRVKMQEAT